MTVKPLKYADLLQVIDDVTKKVARDAHCINELYQFTAHYGVAMPSVLDFPDGFRDWVVEACKQLRIDDGPPWNLKLTTVLRKTYKAACDHHSQHRGPQLLALERFEKEAGERGVLKWLDYVEKQIHRSRSVYLMEQWLVTTYGYHKKYQEDVKLALGLGRDVIETLYMQDQASVK